MSDLWGDVRAELSEMREHYARGSLSPTGVSVPVPADGLSAPLLESLTVGRAPWVHLTCPGSRGDRSHETGEQVKLERDAEVAGGYVVSVRQPTRIEAEAHVQRWSLTCPKCRRRGMWRNPTDLVHDVLRGLAEWRMRDDGSKDPGRCRVAWVRT